MGVVMKKVIKPVAFISLLITLVWLLNHTLTLKRMYDYFEPHTETFRGFYQMERNTVDVIILGSSHAGAAYNPEEMYKETHIRSYNLGSTLQKSWVSYYWTKEALKYQSPKLILFDCFYLFRNGDDEAAARLALDYMRMGEVKLEALKTQMRLYENEKEGVENFIFPFRRYHQRWKELGERDFTWVEDEAETSVYKGYWFYNNVVPVETYEPLVEEELGTDKAKLNDVALAWFMKLDDLCKENGIKLVLINSPSAAFTNEQHNAVAALAADIGTSFIDFCMSDVDAEIRIDKDKDFFNTGSNPHMNQSGARKVSRYLAHRIIEEGWVEGCQDSQWEEAIDFSNGAYNDFELKNTNDFNDYLNLLKNGNYEIFISGYENAKGKLNAENLEQIKNLNLDFGVKEEDTAYIAITDGNNASFERSSGVSEKYECTVRGDRVRVVMKSGKDRAGIISSIKINDLEYSKNLKGLNIVVYSMYRHCVIDSVNFDTTIDEITCHR